MGRTTLSVVAVAATFCLLAPDATIAEPIALKDLDFKLVDDITSTLRSELYRLGVVGKDMDSSSIYRSLANVDSSEALCNLCVTFAGQTVQVLIQAALQESLDLCTDVCSTALSKYGQIYPILCDVFACVFGEGELISKVLGKITPDLDPVLWCMAIDVCPRGHGDGKINNVVVSPQRGPEGTTFTITTFFSVSNSTGLEQMSFQIAGGEIASGQSEVLLNLKDGVEYSVQLSVQAVNDEQAQPPVEWLPGAYDVDIALCKGACDDGKPWSGIQDTASTSFNITG